MPVLNDYKQKKRRPGRGGALTGTANQVNHMTAKAQTSIHLGFVIPAEHRDRKRRLTLVADLNHALDLVTGHFESAWRVDHLQFAEIDVLENFTALSYLSALHPRLKFGSAVVCQSFRSPALLAKMAATLQFMSGGRFILGLGAGWHEEEFTAYGYEFPPAEVRVAQLEEAIQIIKSMWRNETTTFRGRYYWTVEAGCEPRPDPIPPIMVGAFKPKMLRLAANHADWWNVSSTGPVSYRTMVEAFNRFCIEAGRDPSAVRRSWIGGCACAPTHQEAVDLARDRWSADDDEDFGFLGTPAQVLEQMKTFFEMGVDTFMFDCAGFPGSTTLRTLISDVTPGLPQFINSKNN